MPKRERSPDGVIEHIIAIHDPWPPNGDFGLPGDQRKLCQWLRELMGTDEPLLAIYNKPDRPLVVLVEILKEYRDIENVLNRLLGRHKWSQFVRVLNPDDRERSAFISFAYWKSDRQVKKGGWNRIDVEESWFGNDTTRERLFQRPYPKPTYAEPPLLADQTGHRYCTGLPLKYFPEAKILGEISRSKGNKITPGSVEWSEQKVVNTDASAWDLEDLWEHLPTVKANNTHEISDYIPPDPNSNEGMFLDDACELVSDLPLASGTADGNCPSHGLTCKKGVCSWRAEWAKSRPKDVGGPSNSRNYRRGRGGASGRGNWRAGGRETSTFGGGFMGNAPSVPGNSVGRGDFSGNRRAPPPPAQAVGRGGAVASVASPPPTRGAAPNAWSARGGHS